MVTEMLAGDEAAPEDLSVLRATGFLVRNYEAERGQWMDAVVEHTSKAFLGTVHGATDELGFHAVDQRHYVTDLHATVLHQLGLDPAKLEVPGRKRLEADMGSVIRSVLA